MELVSLGSNFKTTSISERERWTIAPARIPDFLNGLLQIPKVEGAVYLATCNRVELYVVCQDGVHLASLFQNFSPAYVYKGKEAFAHLLKVASGLDSLVLGEPEILGQVKQAYAFALEQKVTGPLLNFVFQRVFSVAKQIRTETGIARYPVSISSVAVMLMEQIFGDFKNLTAMVVGLGEMGLQTSELLLKRGVKKLIRANRTKVSENIVSLDHLEEILPTIDLVVTATSSETPLISKEMISKKMENPLVMIDLGVPRDIEPSVANLENVYLYNVDDLKTVADKNLAFRQKEAEFAEKMVEKALATFELEWEKRIRITGRVAQLVRVLP